MTSELEQLIQRYRETEAQHCATLSRIRPTRTTGWVRRSFLGHRSTAHSIWHDYPDVKPRSDGEKAWQIGTLVRWLIETALARMRDNVDLELLRDRNLYKFGSDLTPASAWLDKEEYKKVLNWGLRPDLYSYRRREGGGDEFKRLVPDRKADPALMKRKLTFFARAIRKSRFAVKRMDVHGRSG